ncbi:MAG TPA: FAD-dependent oxidoreductase [Actinomycetes bacterium]|nr:FAD-dependent oxidoreductase [Actinomycetes bacterium]
MPSTSADRAPLVVLGSGPAGLAAAWQAARRGHEVTVLERADRVGGLAGSFDVAGVRVDHGSHRLHPATPPHLLAELRRLLGEDLQTRPRNGRLRVAGSWVGFPLRPAELLRALPPGTIARIGAESVTAPVRRREQPSFAATLRKGLGPTLYREMYAPYAEKLWGLPGERISADQAAKRVTADTPWKVAARVLRLDRSARAGQGRVFHYPRRGFGQIVDALADAATAAGATIRLEEEVTEVGQREDGVTVRTASGRAVEAAQAFSTVPLPVLARLADPGPPDGVLAAAARLRFRAMVLVYVVHEGGRWSPYDAHYVPGPETPVTRLSEPANYRVSDDDPADRSVLCAEVPCAVGDALWSASEDELADLVDEALRVTGLPRVRRGAVVVRRLPHVYPVYEPGYEEHLAGLDLWVGSLPRVTTFGRLGLFAHDNTHHALAMAYDAVAALRADGSRDETAWSAARARFADHVVED